MSTQLVNYLSVAGGGGSGTLNESNSQGGGGGAGGVLSGTALIPLDTIVGISVGLGGAAISNNPGSNNGLNGENSTIGTNGYLTSPNSADFDFGSGDFTIEAWVNVNQSGLNQNIVVYSIDTPVINADWAFILYVKTDNRVHTALSDPAGNSGSFIDSSVVLVNNTWNFIQVTRTSGTLELWVNGVSQGTTSYPYALSNTGSFFLSVGNYSHNLQLSGNLNDVRLTKGIARSGGSIPVAAFPIGISDPDWTSVSLLLPMNGTEGQTSTADVSQSPHTINTIGDFQISTSTSQWGGSSGLFTEPIIVSLGGGGGGAGGYPGLPGGSGGGAGYGNATNALGTPGQGFNGGASSGSQGAGGGGAGGQGGADSLNQGGSGGLGISSSITGTAVSYASGGGGATSTGGTQSIVYPGGGGVGVVANQINGSPGTDGLGGGAGGTSNSTGVSYQGGSGVVILSYPLTTSAATTTGSPIVTTDGSGNRVYTFLTSGTILIPGVVAPVNTIPPNVTGTPVVGQVLTTDNGTWSNTPTSYTYQWFQDGETPIGTNTNTYTCVTGDIGHNISCTVTATNGAGSVPATSNSVGPITAQYLVTYTGMIVTVSGVPVLLQDGIDTESFDD